MSIRIVSSSFASRPEWLMIRSFAITILVGTFLLALPASNRSGRWMDPLSAAFMATSATCVTGLVVCDPGSTFTPLGQGILLGLIQLGGLQIMTLGTLALILLGGRLSLREEFVTIEALGHSDVRDLPSLVRQTVLFTFTMEATGCLVLAWLLHARHGMSAPMALYHGGFHAVSAFCNAGFALYPDSLAAFRHDPIALMVLCFLIVLGGLGFGVLYNLGRTRSWRRLSLHSRLTLSATALLILAGWIIFLILEYNHSLAGLSALDKTVCALFQSITPRTAGFSVVDMSAVQEPTLLVTMVLMFIGGSSASTAGGIKITTLVVLALTVAALIRGRRETEVMNRALPEHNVRAALAVFLLSLTCLLTAFLLLLIFEPLPPASGSIGSAGALFFETVSALGTVGLSTGITPHLGDFGRLCIMVCMFIGKVGPLAIAVMVGSRELRQSLRYPQERIVVG